MQVRVHVLNDDFQLYLNSSNSSSPLLQPVSLLSEADDYLQGIKIEERVPIPPELVPKDAQVEIAAKVYVGYHGGDIYKVNEADLKKVVGRGTSEY
jgi:hypothetical protein